MKRRSDIRKLISALRVIWRQSETCSQLAKEAKDPNKTGYFICNICKKSWPKEFMKKDHIVPVGREPESLFDPLMSMWISKLFCSIDNLQAVCGDCHKDKSKRENKERRNKNV